MSSSSSSSLSSSSCIIQCGSTEIETPRFLFINNEFVPAESGKFFNVENPATEQTIAQVAEAGAADVDKAVKAARHAFENGWRDSSPQQRATLMRRLVQLLRNDADSLAKIESVENGKPLQQSIDDDIPSLIDAFEYYAGWCDKIEGETIASSSDQFFFTLRSPKGVCAMIVPFNFSSQMLCWKIAPAIACGCTVILKPCEKTPINALRFASWVKEAGFPPGVVNIVTGFGPTCGGPMASHPDVDKISFTGSTATGRLIMQLAAKSNLKDVSLELGGKSANIVFDDADLDRAVKHAWTAVMFNAGQVCTAGSRTFVHQAIYQQFIEKFAALAKDWKVGDAFTDGVDQGPLISKAQFEKVLGYIEKGKNEGARLVTGGHRIGDVGYFIEPTIFADVEDNMTIAREEIFGPVASVFKFSSLSEVIKRANASDYGLAAAVFTQDITKAHHVARRLEAGTVYVNQYFGGGIASGPFGGFKQSGIGRECGKYALELYTEVKSVKIALPLIDE